MKLTLHRKRMEIHYGSQIYKFNSPSGDDQPQEEEDSPKKPPLKKKKKKKFSWITKFATRFYKRIKPKTSPTPIIPEDSTPPPSSSSSSPSFFSSYHLQKPLNEGTFSKVYQAMHKFTREPVAVKKVDKVALKEEIKGTYFEIQALKSLSDHPHICRLYQTFETEKMILIVLEKCREDLFHIIHRNKRIREEPLGTRIFRQIVQALEHIHSKGFCHRDLKPENVLFDENGDVKLIDFNLSAAINYSQFGWNKLKTHCGTIEYAAPELLTFEKRHYEGPPVDSWCLGVLLYIMLVGRFPFEDPDRRNKILNCEYKLPSYLSKESRNLILHLMQANPKSRLTPSQILQHKWLNKKNKNSPPPQNRIVLPYQQIPEISEHPPQQILDEEILQLISQVTKIPKLQLELELCGEDSIEKNNEELLATYNILQRKKEILGGSRFPLWKIIWKRELLMLRNNINL